MKQKKIINTKQHYLPRDYLRRWTIDARKEPDRVYLYDLWKGEARRTNVSEVGHEKGFFDYVDDNGKINSYDPQLHPYEDYILRALRAFCLNPTWATLQLHRHSLAGLAAYFLLANAATRRDLRDIIAGINRFHGEDVASMTEADLHRHHVRLIFEAIPSVTTKLMEKKWMLVHNHGPIPFWTSDVALAISDVDNARVRMSRSVKEPPDPSKAIFETPLRMTLLRQPSARLWFPLSPTHLLIVADPIRYATEPGEKDADIYLVAEANQRQVYAATRFVFSNENEFTLASELRKHDSVLQQPNRSRWKITGVLADDTASDAG